MLGEIQSDTDRRMTKTVEAVKTDLGGIRTGKATPALLDSVKVEAEAKPPSSTTGTEIPKYSEVNHRPQMAETQEDDGTPFVLVIVVVGLVGFGAVGVMGFRRYARRRAAEEMAEFNDWPEQSVEMLDNDLLSVYSGDNVKKKSLRYCPTCNRIFETNANYCPFDKDTLVESEETKKETKQGMICPKCHRGYEMGAKFCPHDSEPLVPYAEWRISKKPLSQ